jgi:hypothetical protein
VTCSDEPTASARGTQRFVLTLSRGRPAALAPDAVHHRKDGAASETPPAGRGRVVDVRGSRAPLVIAAATAVGGAGVWRVCRGVLA